MSTPRSMPTLLDVAKALGVSRTTVSNAYNRPEKLSAELREEILATARKLGYFGPDPRAAALRRKRTLGAVGLVMHHDLRYIFSDPASGAFLQGVADELDARSLTLHLIPKVDRKLVLSAAHQSPADVIIVHCEVGKEHAEELKALRKPVVLVDTMVSGVPSVTIDDRGAAAQAMAHVLKAKPDVLIVLGFLISPEERKRIFGRARLPRTGFVGSERLAGYVQGLRQAGRDPESVVWLEVDDQYPDQAREVLAAARASLPAGRNVALLAMSDRMAIAGMAELRRWRDRKLVAAVGFDDIDEAAAAGLTTLRQDNREKGRQAVRVVIDGQAKPSSLPVELVVRKT